MHASQGVQGRLQGGVGLRERRHRPRSRVPARACARGTSWSGGRVNASRERWQVRAGLAAVAACTTATGLYALVRVAQSLIFTEPDPALVIWSEHAGFFWRALTVGTSAAPPRSSHGSPRRAAPHVSRTSSRARSRPPPRSSQPRPSSSRDARPSSSRDGGGGAPPQKQSRKVLHHLATPRFKAVRNSKPPHYQRGPANHVSSRW